MTMTKPYSTYYRAQRARIALKELVDHADQNGDTEVLAVATAALAKIDMILRAGEAAIKRLPEGRTVAGGG